MLQYVNTVLIGTNCPASYSNEAALSKGDVALFDENKKILTSANAAEAAKAIYVGVAADTYQVADNTGALVTKREIKFSAPIQKGSKPTMVYSDYVAPTEDVIEIAFSGSTIEVGHRFVLRLVYGDLYEAPGQFTHTYEVIASTETADDLGNALLAKINKHANRRVSATFASHKLTLTAMEKDDNEGVNSLNEYSVVSMEASLYVTIPGALLSNVPEAVPGATITKTAGKPGKGYWKQVRDMEVRMLGYKGHVFTDAYPAIEPKRNVEEGSTYDYFTIENDNLYLSPDNQYIKTTPLTTEVYIEHNTTNKTSVFAKALKAFITGEAE